MNRKALKHIPLISHTHGLQFVVRPYYDFGFVEFSLFLETYDDLRYPSAFSSLGEDIVPLLFIQSYLTIPDINDNVQHPIPPFQQRPEVKRPTNAQLSIQPI
ncbi:hypothetical protein H2248_004253 [Termitomyces sp. 'cryptogamus']|nr:hypothetical protein H2248_004253 [Termitomyces sp. 'cryptogamus']